LVRIANRRKKLDIAGMAWGDKDKPTTPKGATAFGVRLLDRLVADNFEG
jgi:leucyl aminopeptidase